MATLSNDELAALYASAHQGDSHARVRLARHLLSKGDSLPEDERNTALQWIQDAAEKNDLEALRSIGEFHEYGLYGLKPDPALAVECYTRAAEGGDIPSMTNIGILHANGWGIPKNPELGAKWMKQAAEAGHVTAMYQLGLMYIHGDGVLPNTDLSLRWLNRAAESGSSEAAFTLAEAYLHGQIVPQDLALAMEWYLKSAEAGFPEAYFSLGNIHAHGIGVPEDADRAANLYYEGAKCAMRARWKSEAKKAINLLNELKKNHPLARKLENEFSLHRRRKNKGFLFALKRLFSGFFHPAA